jgi:hypothetical protein
MFKARAAPLIDESSRFIFVSRCVTIIFVPDNSANEDLITQAENENFSTAAIFIFSFVASE